MKKLVSLVLVALMCLTLMLPSMAASNEAVDAADYLHELGLFNGVGTNPDGSPNYDLDHVLTREQAITLLVRLLSCESIALAGTWTMPFTDISEWSRPYVGYAYQNGLTSGTSNTTFSGSDAVSATQFLTFILRALGYDSTKDFHWDSAWELTDRLKITNGEYSFSNSPFTRGDAVVVLVNSLSVAMKDAETTLLDMVTMNRSSVSDAIINMSEIMVNELSPYEISSAPPYRSPDEYDWVYWDESDITTYFGRSFTPAYIPQGLTPSVKNGVATVIFDKNGTIVVDEVGFGFYHSYHDDGSPMLTEKILAHKGFSIVVSRLGILDDCIYILPENEVKASKFGDVDVTIGYRSMPYGPYDSETHEPSGYYDFYEVRFTINDVDYRIRFEQIELSVVINVTASLIYGDKYEIVGSPY